MLWAFKHLKKANYIRVLYFLQNVDFLQNFLSWKFIFHITFLNSFYCNFFPCQFMDPKCNFTKSPFSNKFYKFIVFQTSWRKPLVLLDKSLDISNQTFIVILYETVEIERCLSDYFILIILWTRFSWIRGYFLSCFRSLSFLNHFLQLSMILVKGSLPLFKMKWVFSFFKILIV